MKQKKILILYSTAGMGHKKAAEAIDKAFREMLSGADSHVEMLDTLAMANSVYKFLYLDGYVFLMTKARWLWGILYYFSDNPIVDAVTRKLRAFLDYQSLPALADAITERAPDAIIATHFILPSVAGILRKKLDIKARFYTLVTDYGPHSYWLSKDVDRFFVGSDTVASEMASRRIPFEKITVTGIPVDKEFTQLRDPENIRTKYNIDGDKKTIFLMSGGFGVGPVEEMLTSLNSCQSDIQVIVVCGHNERAYESISILKDQLDYPVILFGFTDKVAELMTVSDIMITKAGGISTTEALDAELPMILFASIPGQETWNEKFLTSSGAALKANSVDDLPVLSDRILLSEDDCAGMKAAISKTRKPNAASDIVKKVWGEIT